MATARFNQTEMRKPAASPRPKGRENSKDTLCRNVLIYGHCRYEDQGCAFNHDPNKTLSAQPDSRNSPYLPTYVFWDAGPDLNNTQPLLSPAMEHVLELEKTTANQDRIQTSRKPSGQKAQSPVLETGQNKARPSKQAVAPGIRMRLEMLLDEFRMASSQKDTNPCVNFSRSHSNPIIHSPPLQPATWLETPERIHSGLLGSPALSSIHRSTGGSLPNRGRPHGQRRRTGIRSEWLDGHRTTANDLHSVKKSLNVDSPSFTPTTFNAPRKSASITSQAANAAPFTPQGLVSGTATPNAQPEAEQATFNPAQIREFTPSGYDLSQNVVTNDSSDTQVPFDPFSMSAVAQAMPSAQYNPYLEENSNLANNGSGYFQTQANYSAPVQPLQYHLYAPIGPHREDLLAYQRLAHDFFMPEKLREDLQKKAEASLQVMPNSQLPTLENYHTLVALDTSHHKSATVFGYPSWVYKATSSKNGNLYCLRRLEGYRLTNENAIRSVKDWRRVDNGGVVSVHDAFTTRAFGDSSLIFVTDYHPLSKTLVEYHFTSTNRFGTRVSTSVPEQTLWGYIVQLASAIKAVHAANLAVRCMEPSKVLLTDKNRIRINACSILDVVQHEAQRSLSELQQEDFIHLGKLILSIATNGSATNIKLAVDQIGRTYTTEFRDTIIWLLTPAQAPATKNIGELLGGISGHIVSIFDNILHESDTLASELTRELENGRLARLVMKLGTINERQEYDGDLAWSENGERYMLKLFRDYVFHQVDAEGRPVVDLGHIVGCLNKLDAGIDEKVLLTSRDEQTCFVVTYKELKKQVTAAFGDLTKSSKGRF